MVHHLSSDARPRGGMESVPESVARIPLVWLISADPEEHSFPRVLAPGDFALSERGDIWLYNGLRWNLLVPSVATTPSEPEIRGLRVLDSPQKLEVQYE